MVDLANLFRDWVNHQVIEVIQAICFDTSTKVLKEINPHFLLIDILNGIEASITFLQSLHQQTSRRAILIAYVAIFELDNSSVLLILRTGFCEIVIYITLLHSLRQAFRVGHNNDDWNIGTHDRCRGISTFVRRLSGFTKSLQLFIASFLCKISHVMNDKHGQVFKVMMPFLSISLVYHIDILFIKVMSFSILSGFIHLICIERDVCTIGKLDSSIQPSQSTIFNRK